MSVLDPLIPKRNVGRILTLNQRKQIIGNHAEIMTYPLDIDEAKPIYKPKGLKGQLVMKNPRVIKNSMDINDEQLDLLGESIIVKRSKLEKKSQQGRYEMHRSRIIFAGNIYRK